MQVDTEAHPTNEQASGTAYCLRAWLVISLVVCWLTVGMFASGAAATAQADRANVRPVASGQGVVRSASGGAVAEAPLPDGRGFWSVTADGAVTSYGSAPYKGGMSGKALNAPVLSIASTPDGQGYWLVAADGGMFSFGDARFYGSTGNLRLVRPIVGMAPTPDGKGYWLVAADGGMFSFGDARFYGSTGNLHLDAPIVGMAPTRTDNGYWLVASDGGVFTFGKAAYYGSASGHLAGGSAVGMIATTGGYWIATTGGAVLSFGSAPHLTQPATHAPAPSPKVGPLTNITPSASFDDACYRVSSSTCNSWALQAIDAAHVAEGLPPLSLPSDFSALNDAQQLLVITNSERQERRLPTFSASGSLNALALAGALADNDPLGPGGVTWASNWALGFATPLAADFVWMYDDGLGSNNIDCTPANQAGCWGHRRNILVPWAGLMGAATVTVGGANSLTELFVDG